MQGQSPGQFNGPVFQGTYSGQLDGNLPQAHVILPFVPPPTGVARNMNGEQINTGLPSPTGTPQSTPGHSPDITHQRQFVFNRQQSPGSPVTVSVQSQTSEGSPVVLSQPVPGMPGMQMVPVHGGPLLQTGRWSDGLCDCFQDLSSCCMAVWVAPYRFAQTMDRAQVRDFKPSLGLYLVPWVLGIITLLLGFKVWLPGRWITLCSFLALVLIGAIHRVRFRQKANIAGGEIEDCFMHCFCTICALTQEARHADRAVGALAL